MKRSCSDCIHDKLCDKVAIDIGIPFVNPDTCEDYMNKADVAGVVRCKDCKHRRKNAHRSYCLPTFGLKEITDLNAFCSYGERK